ncbi:hypothetical protein [Chachezhania sediminis]|uniref:hypothetical protein n=1 Tax=Chachezhania sediminis TaxID=2599291 RepID=UPI00131DBAC7|nr:hypothetical protein [Chachezhania sediminis]
MTDTWKPAFDAHRIAAQPEAYADHPELYRAAWVSLKAERGQSVDLQRMGPALHRIQPEGHGNVVDTVAAIRQRAAGKAAAYIATTYPGTKR